MVEAIAQFDYTPQEPDELTLQQGDIIGDIVCKSEGWWEGTLLKNKKRGMFPDNFVKVMEEESPSKDASAKKKSIRLCKVRFSYTPANSDELELKIDDIIQILGEVEEGWWSGQLNNKIGVFPSNFVEEIISVEPPLADKPAVKEEMSYPSADKVTELHSSSIAVGSKTELEAPSLPPKPVKEQYQALFPWEAQNDDELTLKKDDVITLISKEVADKGWWKGELNGKIGLFPDNFVIPYSAPEPKSPVISKVSSNQTKESPLKLAVSPNQIANVRKSLDNSPKAESQSSPPIVSKKPQLPPPPPPALKKPQCSPSPPNPISVSPSGSLSKQNSATSLKLSLPTSTNSPPQSPTKKEQDPSIAAFKIQGALGDSRLSASVSAPCAVSPDPKKTASSQREHSESTSSEPVKETVDGCLPSKLTSGSYTVTNPSTTPTVTSRNTPSNQTNSESPRSNEANGVDTDLDVVSRDGSLYHPTLFRAKAPRKRPPSTIILKEEFTLPEELTNGNGTVSNETNVEVTETSPHQANKPPWVEELKLNQAKKNLLQGRTRVIIGPSQTTAASSSDTGTVMTSTTIISSSSMGPATVGGIEQTTTITSGKSGFVTTGVGVTFRPNASGAPQRPVSMYSGDSQQTTANENVSVSLKEWNELYSKIDRLELALLNQQETFSKELATLRKQLNEEVGHRKKMRQEIDKLINLMTQV